MKNDNDVLALEDESEYDVIRWPLNWGASSILVFVLAFTYGNNADYSRGWMRTWAETSAILLLGLLFGIVGRRRDDKRFAALVGNLLNGGVLLTFILIVIAFFAQYYQLI